VVYLAWFLSLAAGSLLIRLNTPRKPLQKWLLTLFAFGGLFLLMVLRDPMLGADNDVYAANFSLIEANGFSFIFHNWSKDYLFWLLMWVVTLFKGNYLAFKVVLYLLSCGLLALYAYRKSTNPDVFVLILLLSPFLPFFSTILREGLSLSLVVAGVSFLDKKNLKSLIPYYVFVLLACLCHTSALVFLLLPLLFYFPLFHRIPFLAYLVVLMAFFLIGREASAFFLYLTNNAYQLEYYPTPKLFSEYPYVLFLMIFFALFYLLYSGRKPLESFREDLPFVREKAEPVQASLISETALARSPMPYELLAFILLLLYLSTRVSSNLFRLYFFFMVLLFAPLSSLFESSSAPRKLKYLPILLLVFIGVYCFVYERFLAYDTYSINAYRFLWEAAL
jgi:hypothetical protein